MKKRLLSSIGHLFLALGLIGAFLPVLPTTPFLLLAIYFYSKTNHKLHQWLYNHKIFGPSLRDWENHKAIGIRAKLISTLMISFILFWRIPRLEMPAMIKIIISLILGAVLTFIWTRPSRNNY